MTDSQATRPYFRSPTISPDGAFVAFVYAGDIWMVPLEGGVAERLTANPAGHSSPRFSPDGSQIVFTSSRTGQGDLYSLPLGGGGVRRLTYHDMASTAEDWTPDSQYLFFSSARDQQSVAMYRIDAQGGTPIPWITQPYERINSLHVSPDGEFLVFNVSRDFWWRRGPNPYGGSDIWIVSNAPDATDFRKISDYSGMNRWPQWTPDQQGLYFVSDRDGMENLWYQSLESGEKKQLTEFREGRLLWPTISQDGKTIVFERDFGIWRFNVETGESMPIPITVRPDTKITPVQFHSYNREINELALSPDGKKVAFIVHGEVFADFADKETDKEQRIGSSYRVTNTPARERHVRWSPDSRRLVYTSDRFGDSEIFSYDFTSRSETRLTNSLGMKNSPQYSPNGKWLAYGCGDSEIRLIDTENNTERPFIKGFFSFSHSFAWSPDSQWIVFVARDNQAFSNLYVQHIESDTPRQVTFLSNLDAYGPIWAPNGRFIIFTTGQYRAEAQIARLDLAPQPPIFREDEFEKLFELPAEQRPTPVEESKPEEQKPAEPKPEELKPSEPKPDDQPKTPEEQPKPEQEQETAPKPDDQQQKPVAVSSTVPPSNGAAKPVNAVEIVFEGIERRTRFLTPTQLDADAMCISPDSRDLVFGAAVAGKYNLWTLPLDEARSHMPPRQITSVASYKDAAQFSPEGKQLFFLEGGQIVIRKFPVGDQQVLQVSADVQIDFHQEKLQIFGEAWRLLRDHFYDPTFRGLDWQTAYKQFLPLVSGAQTYSDLLNILNLLVGELRASHLGASAPWSVSIRDGYTGMLFDSKALAEQHRFIIKQIVPDSPAALAVANGVKIEVGDELLAVNGVQLSRGINLDQLLQRTVARRVQLSIAKGGDIQQNKEIAIRPISAGNYDHLRYRSWVYANEQYVHQISDGRLGYVHIRRMDYECYQQFLIDLDAETHSKEGVVIDVRFNGGGHTATFILDVLTRPSVLLSVFRDRPTVDAGHLAGNRVLNKPTVLVINQSSFSNTEMFAEGYRRLKLGKVVGRPTGGAVIWTFRVRLLDGTSFSLPRIKVATPEGEDLEGKGRAVDIDITLPVGEAAQGRDSQLEAAVKALLEQLDTARA